MNEARKVAVSSLKKSKERNENVSESGTDGLKSDVSIENMLIIKKK